MKCYTRCFLSLIFSALISLNLFAQPNNKTELFNGKDFTGWDTYIGPPMDDAWKKLSEVPVGLNNDPNHVFTIVNDSGEKVIRISGENWGAFQLKKNMLIFICGSCLNGASLPGVQRKRKRKIVAY